MKKAITIGLICLSLICMAIIFLIQDFDITPPTLYKNGHIITLNDEQPFAEAMLIINGKISEIGTNEHLEKHVSSNTIVVDLEGHSVLPGFIDPHTHFAISMFLSEMHDLSGFTFKSNKDIWNAFENIVKNTEKGKWIICKGIDPVLVSDLIPPSIDYLNAVAPENPVLFFSQSLHNYWANSKAFESVGINNKTLDPSKHSYYSKDKHGNLNGLIVEQEAIKPFFDIIKTEVLTPKKLSKISSKVMKEYAKKGNTTIVSAGITAEDKRPFILFKHLSNNQITVLGGLLSKLNYLPKRRQNPRHFIYMRHDMAHLLPKKSNGGNDFYGIIGIKHWYDGSPYIGSMYLNEPYLNTELSNNKLHIPKNHKGHALIEKDTLKSFIRSYHKNGWQIALHTQGDAAISQVIDIFDELANELDFSNSRHRLEHCLLFPKDKIIQLKKLNLTPSFHVNHLFYYGDALKQQLIGRKRADNMLPIGFVKNSGIKYSLHSDQPMFESDPFRLIQTSVERKTLSGDTLGDKQKLSVLEAIKSLTRNAAWQINMENKIGSLEKGKYADFIIIDKNPLKIQTHKLSTIKCLKTFVNGNLVK